MFEIVFDISIKISSKIYVTMTRLSSCSTLTSHDNQPDGFVRTRALQSSHYRMPHTQTASNSTRPTGRIGICVMAEGLISSVHVLKISSFFIEYQARCVRRKK